MALFGGTKKIALTVEGMSCGHCEMKVKNALEAVDGVKSASVDREKKHAEVVVGKSSRVSQSDLVAAVAGAGYTATAV